MKFKWNHKKHHHLKKSRGLDFNELIEVFHGIHHLSIKLDEPEQWRAIGWSRGKLVTIIYEERASGDEIYFWLITAWKATPAEEKLFNET